MSSVVTLHDVSFELPNGRELFSHLHLSLGPSLTALVGPNGVGKTCLARMIAGELEPASGTVRTMSAPRNLGGEKFEMRGELRRGALETLSIDQRCASLDDDRIVLENVREVSTSANQRSATRSRTSSSRRRRSFRKSRH